MTAERKQEIKGKIADAITALLDAQLAMLADIKEPVYNWNRERVLGPELCAAFLAVERAESVTIDASRLFGDIQ